MLAKRSLSDVVLPAKRSRESHGGRLCDLRNALTDLFTNRCNASRARERGILRSRDASAKYEEYERKLFALIKDSGSLELPDEDWVLEILPELKALEADTLDMLLGQAEQHARYEKAARELVSLEVAKVEEQHERELRALRLERESDQTRSSVGAEMRMKAQEELAREEQEQLRAEAMEKIGELEEEVAKLEGELEEQKAEMERQHEGHKEEIAEMTEERDKILQAYEDAHSETELKREASRKLKEEIIDNDRLTVANLNRIKNLELELDETRTLCAKLDGENEEMRAELEKTVHNDGQTAELEEEVTTLRELLEQREQQLMSMTQRLAEGGLSSGSSASARRDSLLDRLGIGHKASSAC